MRLARYACWMLPPTIPEGLPNLFTLRRLRGLSQAALAKELGVSERSVIRWEMGDSDPPLGHVRRLAAYFGISVAYLIGEVNEFGQPADPARR